MMLPCLGVFLIMYGLGQNRPCAISDHDVPLTGYGEKTKSQIIKCESISCLNVSFKLRTLREFSLGETSE